MFPALYVSVYFFFLTGVGGCQDRAIFFGHVLLSNTYRGYDGMTAMCGNEILDAAWRRLIQTITTDEM